jgi:hypothetical protein
MLNDHMIDPIPPLANGDDGFSDFETEPSTQTEDQAAGARISSATGLRIEPPVPDGTQDAPAPLLREAA